MKNRWLYHSLVAAIIIFLWVPTARNLWQGRTGSGPAIEPLPVKTSSVQPAALPAFEQYAVVSERNLFGGSGENAPPEEKTSLESMPQADKNLGLRLVGTVVTDDPKLNLAFIEDGRTRRQEPYRAGDTVGNARVKNVLRNNVVIATARGDELLIIKPQEEGQSVTPARQQAHATTPARRQAGVTPVVGEAAGAANDGSKTSGASPRASLPAEAAEGGTSPSGEQAFERALTEAFKGNTLQEGKAQGTQSEVKTAKPRALPPDQNPFLKALKQAQEQRESGNVPPSQPAPDGPLSELLRRR